MKKIIILFFILFLTPCALFAQNNTNNSTLSAKAVINVNKKDPKLITITNYKPIEPALLEKKLEEDNAKREEFKKDFDEEYFELYLIFEKILRANKLQYQNWRVGIKPDAEELNAYNIANYVAIHSSLYDSFFQDPDALAFVICHELSHNIFNHLQKIREHRLEIEKCNQQLKYNQYRMGDGSYLLLQTVIDIGVNKLYKEEREMELQADKEALTLMARAGYDVEKSKDVFSFFTQTGEVNHPKSTHPTSDVRIRNVANEIKLLNLNSLKKQGEYNIYNSEVLEVKKSSDKKTLVISRPQNFVSAKYVSQKPEDKLLQSAYRYYLNNNYALAEKYFLEAFEQNSSNYIPALYLSYIFEQRFKANKDKKNLTEAKSWAKKATNLNPTDINAQRQYDDIIDLIKTSKN